MIEDKKHNVADFHKNTLHSFLEIVGAMGLSNPSDLKPEYIMRRINDRLAKPLSEIFEYLKPGQLLGSDIPKDFKKYWQAASLEKF